MTTLNRYNKRPQIKGWGGALKGAGTGAAMGSTIGSAIPVIGTAVGTVAGAVGGALFGHFIEEKKLRQERKARSKMAGLQRTATIQRVQLANQAEAADQTSLSNFDLSNNELYMSTGGKLLRKGGLLRSKNYSSSRKPYPSVKSGDFAGGNRSYPIPTKADAIDALRLAGLHGRSDVRAKVYAKYPSLSKPNGGKIDEPDYTPTPEDRALYPISFGTPTFIGRGRMDSSTKDTDQSGNWANYNELSGYVNSKLSTGTTRKKFVPISVSASRATPLVGKQRASAGYVTYSEDKTKPIIGYKTRAGRLMVGKYVTDDKGNEKIKYTSGTEEELLNFSNYITNRNESDITNMKLNPKGTGITSKRNVGVLNLINEYRNATGYNEDFYNLRPGIDTTNKPMATKQLNNLKAAGGKLTKDLRIPAKEGKYLGDNVYLLTDENGSTSGTHEQGDNIPIRKKGKTIAYAEPGEVVVKDMVLSKRIGENGTSYADEYMQLEQLKREIENRQDALPKLNDNRLKNRSKFNVINAGSAPLAFTGMDLSAIVSGASTVGSYLLGNKALNRQKKYINESLSAIEGYAPKLNKVYTDTSKTDISNEIEDVNAGFTTANSMIDTRTSGVTGSALRSSAAIQRAAALRKIYADANRLDQAKRGSNINLINQNNLSNIGLINQANQMKLQGKLDTYSALANLEAAKTENLNVMSGEFNKIGSNYMAAQSIASRYSDTVGEDALPASWRKISFKRNKSTVKNNATVIKSIPRSTGYQFNFGTGNYEQNTDNLTFPGLLNANGIYKNGGSLKRKHSKIC